MVRLAPLGRILIDAGVLTQGKLDEALALQKTDRRRLGEILVGLGFVNPNQLAQLLSHQMSCPWISLAHLDITNDVLAIVTREIALEHGIIPVHVRPSKGENVLYVATDDPTDEDALAACATAAGMQVRAMVAVTGEVRAALARYYDGPPITDVPPTPQAVHGDSASDSKKPAKPPPVPARPAKDPPRERIEENEENEVVFAKRREKRAPTVLALNAPSRFLAQCGEAVSALGATLIDGGIGRADELVIEHRPCAIIVTDDVYAFDRSGLNRLALEHDAHLVVWSEEVDGRQLQPLLSGAIDRWGRSSYEMGAVVDSRYELLRDLGASRWEVRHVHTARRWLLALAVRAEDGDAAAAAIRCEQKALARVTHPSAIELHDAGTTELGDPYIVLEPFEGRTLDGLVAARTKLVARDACAVVLQVADVLAAAHAVGVEHHHISAENIVVARDAYGLERVKLLHWGHSTVVDPAAVKVQDDIKALAMCAFEALTGRRPGRREDMISAGIPEPVARVLSRALTMEIASAKALAQALTEALPDARELTHLLDASPHSRDTAAGKPQGAGPAEQRRFTRAAYRTPLRIEVPGADPLDGHSEDISAGGLLVVAKAGLKGNTEVIIKFALPLNGRVVAEPAVIKWSRAARSDNSTAMCAIGVAFRSASPETIRQVERYISLMGT